MLNMWERKILRKVYVSVIELRFWISRINGVLNESYKTQNLSSEFKKRGLEWLRHVRRMDQTRIINIILLNKPEDKWEDPG
jgi:hypothetical protein